MAAQGTSWTLEDLYLGIMRSWFVLVGVIVLFALVGAGVFMIYPQKYTADALHTVEPISVLTSGSSFNTVNMETEKVVATSTAVLERAAAQLDDTSVDALRANTTIEVPRDSQVLVFHVTANTPALAADRANALAVAYGEERTKNARDVVTETTEELGKSITALQAVVSGLPEGSAERSAAELQVQSLLDEQARITATPFYSGALVTPANPPQASNRPSVLVFIAAGLFLGILVGAIAALIVSRVRGPSQSYRRTGEESTAQDQGDNDDHTMEAAGPFRLDDDHPVDADRAAETPVARPMRAMKRGG